MQLIHVSILTPLTVMFGCSGELGGEKCRYN